MLLYSIKERYFLVHDLTFGLLHVGFFLKKNIMRYILAAQPSTSIFLTSNILPDGSIIFLHMVLIHFSTLYV